MLRKTITTSLKKKSHPPSHAIIEDMTGNYIAQMAPKSKTYTPCILAIIIKCCNIIAQNRQKHMALKVGHSEKESKRHTYLIPLRLIKLNSLLVITLNFENQVIIKMLRNK